MDDIYRDIRQVHTVRQPREANYLLSYGYRLLGVQDVTREARTQEGRSYIQRGFFFIIGRPDGVALAPLQQPGQEAQASEHPWL